MGIVIGIIIIAILVFILFKLGVFTMKKINKELPEEPNPCADCEFHECRMSHYTCDKLAKNHDLK